jgi:hypothetical protein
MSRFTHVLHHIGSAYLNASLKDRMDDADYYWDAFRFLEELEGTL